VTADERRDRYLAEHGVRVLRFTDLDVLQHPESIETALSEALNPHPGPLPEGEGT
jgi:very-short-patch-repair endonuclease